MGSPGNGNQTSAVTSEACARCGEVNPPSNLVCTICGARLPWAGSSPLMTNGSALKMVTPYDAATPSIKLSPRQTVMGDLREALGPKAPIAGLVLMIATGLIGWASINPFISHATSPSTSIHQDVVASPTSSNSIGLSSTSTKQAANIAPAASTPPQARAVHLAPIVVSPHSPSPRQTALRHVVSTRRNRDMVRAPIESAQLEQQTTTQNPIPLDAGRQQRITTYQGTIDGLANDIRSASTEVQLHSIDRDIQALKKGISARLIQAGWRGNGQNERADGTFLSALGFLQHAIKLKLAGVTMETEQTLAVAQDMMRPKSVKQLNIDQTQFNREMNNIIRQDVRRR